MDYSGVVRRIKPSIALVIVTDAKGGILGKGSGFVFSKKGILVTCNHVVKGGGSILVRFPDSEKFMDAKVVINDGEHDLALLKFDDDSRDPLEQEDVRNVKEGMAVLFAGYPLSLFDLTTHQGMLSAIIKDATGVTTYLIDGTVNSGNSGCPLMTEEGKVIGVVNAKRRERSDLLDEVEKLKTGALSLHGLDLVAIYQALVSNVQLGIGYAVPAAYIPPHRDPEIKLNGNGEVEVMSSQDDKK